MKFNELGRSMIEMLGVLMIIGLLSVMGIAGYMKAMEKYEQNKLMQQYSSLVAQFFEFCKNYKCWQMANNANVTSMFVNMKAIPEGMSVKNNMIYDYSGNYITLSKFNKELVLRIYTPNRKQCMGIVQNIVLPFYEYIYLMDRGALRIYGPKYSLTCGQSHQCVSSDWSLDDFQTFCNGSTGKDDENLVFSYVIY